MDQQLPVKYVLYSHYGYLEARDFEAWRANSPCCELDGIRYFEMHLPRLIELLSSAAYEGVLILYYAAGVSECVREIAEAPGRTARDELCRKSDSLRFADDVQRYIDQLLERYPGERFRVRFVTSLDLV